MHTGTGSHGTTRSRADSICSSGFIPSEIGRKGSGVYFWYAEEICCDEARKLAVAWYESELKRGNYSSDQEQRCAVLWAELTCDEDNLLNLMNPAYRSYIRRLLEQHVVPMDKQLPEDIISSVHDVFIKQIAQKKAVDIVLATVTAPKMSDKLKVAVGEPFAYIVKNLECIRLNPVLTEVM